MTTMRDLLESKQGGSFRSLLERLEAMTKTGVPLRVLPGGAGGGMERAASGGIQTASKAPPSTEKQPGRELGNAGIAIGSTVEKNGLRMHRYASSLRVMDMTNAGKRGKTVEEFALYNLDWKFSKEQADVLEKALAAIVKARTYDQALRIATGAVKEARSLAGAVGSHMVDVEENKLRGIDVEPPEGSAGSKIKIVTKEFELEASARDFSVRQKLEGTMDTTNHIPPVHGAKKTAIKQFYAWVQQNEKAIRGWSYRQLMQAMIKADLDYHSYSTYD